MARSEVLFTVKDICTMSHKLELPFLMIVMSAFPPFCFSVAVQLSQLRQKYKQV